MTYAQQIINAINRTNGITGLPKQNVPIDTSVGKFKVNDLGMVIPADDRGFNYVRNIIVRNHEEQDMTGLVRVILASGMTIYDDAQGAYYIGKTKYRKYFYRKDVGMFEIQRDVQFNEELALAFSVPKNFATIGEILEVK